MTTVQLDDFTRAYIEAALFTTNDESRDDGGDPLEQNYGIDDITWPTLARIVEDCAAFQARQAWGAVISYAGFPCRRLPEGGSFDAQGGHDFWLTRNGHGAGFWDGDWQEPFADALEKAAKAFGEFNLYVGDDGKIYHA